MTAATLSTYETDAILELVTALRPSGPRAHDWRELTTREARELQSIAYRHRPDQ